MSDLDKEFETDLASFLGGPIKELWDILPDKAKEEMKANFRKRFEFIKNASLKNEARLIGFSTLKVIFSHQGDISEEACNTAIKHVIDLCMAASASSFCESLAKTHGSELAATPTAGLKVATEGLIEYKKFEHYRDKIREVIAGFQPAIVDRLKNMPDDQAPVAQPVGLGPILEC